VASRLPNLILGHDQAIVRPLPSILHLVPGIASASAKPSSARDAPRVGHYDHHDRGKQDYSYVLGHALAQGSAPPPYHEISGKAPFDVIVLCAEEWQPHLPQYPRVIHAGFRDAAPKPEETALAVSTAREVVRHIKLRGRSVLVTCQMGWNRSGLVTALALKMMGLSTREAVRRIREARGPNALGNKHFVAFLESNRSP
jgi:hypothetical protein